MVAVQLNVSKKDIIEGCRNSAENCPIARATIRAGFTGVEVEAEYIRFVIGDDTHVISLHGKARRFVHAFDDGEKVKPFKFIVRLTNRVAKFVKLNKRYVLATA